MKRAGSFPKGIRSGRCLRKLFAAAAPVVGLVLLSVACTPAGDGSSAQTNAPAEPVLYAVRGTVVLDEGRDDPTGAVVFCAGTSHAAYADAQGRFAIDGIPGGSYIMAAQKAGYQTLSFGDVQLTSATVNAADNTFEFAEAIHLKPSRPAYYTDLEGEALGPEPTGALLGTVALSDGADPGGTRVDIAGAGLSTLCDSEGRFVFRAVPTGNYDLHIRRPGYSSQIVPTAVAAREVTRIPFVIELAAPETPVEPVSVMGSVLFAALDGSFLPAAPEASVLVRETQQSVPVRPDGTFTLRGLAPGSWTLLATAPGFALTKSAVAEVTGEEPAMAVLVLQERPEEAEGLPGAVTGIVVLEGAAEGEAAGVLVALAGTNFMSVTDNAGAFLLDGIAPGFYELICSRAGYRDLRLPDVEVVSEEVTDVGPLMLERDIEGPEVLFTSPPAGEEITIREAIAIDIGFSKRMRLETVQQAIAIDPPCNFSVRRGSGHVEYSADLGDVIRVEIRSDGANALAFETRYRLTIDATAQDLDGMSLEETFEMPFRTRGLEVLETRPIHGSDLEPGYGSSLLVRFNGRVDRETLTDRTIQIRPRPYATNAAMEIGSDPTTGWTVLQIGATWSFDTEYTVSCSRGIQTVDGVRLDSAPFRFSFRTTDAPALETPTPR